MKTSMTSDDVVISYKIRKIIKRKNMFHTPDFYLIYLSVPTIHPRTKKIKYVEVNNFYITLLENHRVDVSGGFKFVSELKAEDIISLHSSTFLFDESFPTPR